MASEPACRRLSHNRLSCNRWRCCPWLWLLLAATFAHAQTCQTVADMDASVRSALETAAQRYFDISARGDTAALKQNSIASVASAFAGIEAAVKANQSAFAGAKATVRPPFLLTAFGPEPLPRAEFLCGVFGKLGQTKDSAVFVLNDLPPGQYAVAILDVNGGHNASTLTLVLQQAGVDWKLAGFYARPAQAAGHDAAWFAARARAFKAKAQNHNAWLFYRQAIALSTPVDFMSTLSTDQLYDETQAVQPADLPAAGKSVDLSAAGKIYRLTEIYLRATGNDLTGNNNDNGLDVEVVYPSADVSNTARAFEENSAVIKALAAKFPELRDAFHGVVARAVDPSGRDYGTLVAMKEIK